MWCGMAFRIPVIWRDSIPPHETITYTEPLPKKDIRREETKHAKEIKNSVRSVTSVVQTFL